ncbi:hypothetical protein WA158_003894 [Blastocystis sp. Blastoise]
MNSRKGRVIYPDDDISDSKGIRVQETTGLLMKRSAFNFGKLFMCGCTFCCKKYEDFLTQDEMIPIEEIREMSELPFKSDNTEHINMLKDIWKVVFPKDEVPVIPSSEWTKLGFQSENPCTDFRGHGYLSLKCIHYFCKNYPLEFKKIITNNLDYPFLASSTNICSIILYHFNIITSVKLCPCCGTEIMHRKSIPIKEMANLASLLNKDYDQIAFYQLYSIGVLLMDHNYNVFSHSKANFNLLNFKEVLLETRSQLLALLSTKQHDVDSLYSAAEKFLN